jgi:cobalt-zinc-cadmium efflux system membrane fusion protein
MKNKLYLTRSHRRKAVGVLKVVRRSAETPLHLPLPSLAVATIVSFTGCSPKVTARRTSLIRDGQQCDPDGGTAAENPVLHRRAVKFHKTTETTGTVDFDNDQATSVLAPFGGPCRGCWYPSASKVKAGTPLGEVDSPDFAAAISAYRKALATAKTNRRVADMDKDLLEHNGVAQREEEQAQTDAANAEADRDAALQTRLAER